MARNASAVRIWRFCLLFVFFITGYVSPVLLARAAADSSTSPIIIFGFVGGLVRHDDMIHDEVRFAARLRKDYPAGADVETFENRNGETAHQRIITLLDANHDGKLSPEEKQSARIILYGHSWGAAEVVSLARSLEREDIPILLTVQVDSVSKFAQNDEVIPANVAQAVNFYQTDGLLHGTTKIRAEDPARTRIIGNFRFEYADTAYSCANYPWYLRVFMKAHTQIECDPRIWMQVGEFVRSAIHSDGEEKGIGISARP